MNGQSTGGHCCVCIGVCGHTTPPSYCDKHSGLNPLAPKQAQPGLTGWICPVCNAGLSPFVTICPNNHGSGLNPFPWPRREDFID